MFSIENKWLLITTSFSAYFVLNLVYKRLGIDNLKYALHKLHGIRFLNLRHVIGIAVFGVVYYFYTPEYLYLITELEIPKLPVLGLILITIFLCVFIAYKAIKNEIQKGVESEVGLLFAKAWWYFCIRIIFLFCYEFFFRGVMLFSFLEANNAPLAIGYTTILYVLIHAFDSKSEIIGSIPFGILLAVFTILTKSVWYAFFIHLALSAVYEVMMFYYQTIITKNTTL